MILKTSKICKVCRTKKHITFFSKKDICRDCEAKREREKLTINIDHVDDHPKKYTPLLQQMMSERKKQKTRKCTLCMEVKKISQFDRRGDNRKLFRSWCRDCCNMRRNDLNRRKRKKSREEQG